MKCITNCIWAESNWMVTNVKGVITNGYREIKINPRFARSVRVRIGINLKESNMITPSGELLG